MDVAIGASMIGVRSLSPIYLKTFDWAYSIEDEHTREESKFPNEG
ncbi:hypothetical protein [Clostridium puniceum]|nr:hypothetical protein [Clostridium puniceum]